MFACRSDMPPRPIGNRAPAVCVSFKHAETLSQRHTDGGLSLEAPSGRGRMIAATGTRASKGVNVNKDRKKPKHTPGRLGQNVDRSLRLVETWPAKDRRSVDIRRQDTHASSASKRRDRG